MTTTDELESARIRLLMADTENKELLASWLSEQYDVEEPSEDRLQGTFDLAIFDQESFRRIDPARLRDRKQAEAPVALPCLLVASSATIQHSETVWQLVDDVIVAPIEQPVLKARLESLLETRSLSLALAEKNRRLEEFAGIVAHDLRNPLAAARGHAKIARETGDEASFEIAINSLDRMEAIINDVLELSRQGTDIDDPESTDLAVLARDAWESVEAPDATFRCDTDLPIIIADSSRLRQLLENLFRNSIEHGGETVTVSVTSTPDGFAVADDGPGIPAERRDVIFESGFTTNDRGTGFGLDIVQTICTAHGWEITVSESAAGGAQFDVIGIQTD
jgi:signal transduction histidine kinase